MIMSLRTSYSNFVMIAKGCGLNVVTDIVLVSKVWYYKYKLSSLLHYFTITIKVKT